MAKAMDNEMQTFGSFEGVKGDMIKGLRVESKRARTLEMTWTVGL